MTLVQEVRRYWNGIRAQHRPGRFVAARLLVKSGISEKFLIRKDGYQLRFYPTAMSSALWVDPNDRHDDEIFFRLLLRKGDTMVDAGANIGSLTLLASRLVEDSGQVIAVEAHPQIFRYLEANLALNKIGNVVAWNVALGREEGTLLFSNRQEDDQNRVIQEGAGIRVPVRKLDALCPTEKEIALLKIDVEGYEWFVLQGAEETLGRTQCIYYESWDDHLAAHGIRSREITAWLKKRGFRVFKQASSDSLMELAADYCSTNCENLVAVRDLAWFVQRSRFRLES